MDSHDWLAPVVERLPTSTSRASFDYKAKRFVRAAHLPPLERHHGWKEIFSPDARAELTGRQSAFDPVDLLRARYAETEGADELARLQDVDLGVYLVDDLLVKTDRASMAHSLEARVPYLDTVVTNLALALPTKHKLRGLSKKVLLRKAAAPLLPRQIVHGQEARLLDSRSGAGSAASSSRSRGRRSPRDVLATSRLLPSRGGDERLLDDHVAGREDRSRQLWGLLAFTLWHERHVERTPRERIATRSARRTLTQGATTRQRHAGRLTRAGRSALTADSRRRPPIPPDARLDSSEWPADPSSPTSSARGRTT